MLLDAAHIVADLDEKFGQPVVPNGIPLSKIHHAAFDAHLIGIDPDFRLHVSESLLGLNDGRCSRPSSGSMERPCTYRAGRGTTQTGIGWPQV